MATNKSYVSSPSYWMKVSRASKDSTTYKNTDLPVRVAPSTTVCGPGIRHRTGEPSQPRATTGLRDFFVTVGGTGFLRNIFIRGHRRPRHPSPHRPRRPHG